MDPPSPVSEDQHPAVWNGRQGRVLLMLSDLTREEFSGKWNQCDFCECCGSLLNADRGSSLAISGRHSSDVVMGVST